ncbi:DUF6588 family protein [Lacinutrix iliipiscaria]|uniref:DUF6588 family protein n=1 Tax=Lacinutrix iliipiscaria TaxID=1230532 RepID=A0ABW5WPI4_9FLAO
MRSVLFLVVMLPFSVAAQDDLANVAGDLISLTQQYVSPAVEATTYQSSSGWFTSAKKKKLWEVEVSVQGNWLFISSGKKTFEVNEANLVNIEIQGAATTATIPTALGGESDVVLQGQIEGEAFEFDAPEGLDESYVNHYQMQFGLGLWKGTTLIGRFSPKIKINSTYYQVVGAGVQHSISQWIPKLEASSFDVAALVSYASYNVSDEFDAADLTLGTINSIDVDGDSFLFNILASKTIKQFDVSAGLGVNVSSFSYKIGGDGELLLDVLNQSLQSLDKSTTNFNADLGVNYNIKNFSVNTMLTFGKYTNIIFGLNYNFNRKN